MTEPAGLQANKTADGNGCNALCKRNDVCGNNTIEALFETCDDGNATDDDNGCSAACQSMVGAAGNCGSCSAGSDGAAGSASAGSDGADGNASGEPPLGRTPRLGGAPASSPP